MAACLGSMSDSLQTSLIIQRQLNSQMKDGLASTSQNQSVGIGFFVQVLLVSALFGIDMVIAFEQIYQILFHQFLGVPVSLLSVNGIVCGAISMTLLPIMGYFTDRGANPKKRKLLSLCVGMCTFLSGLLLLAIGGFIKLAALDAIHENRQAANTTPSTTTSDQALISITSDDVPTLIPSTSVSSSTNTTEAEGGDSQIAVTAVLSIIGFSLIDIGFDMSISITRAFILESTPAFQHTRLLVMATVAASMAGTTFSFIGCFDFPGALGPLFHVEGVAVTLIFFCALLFFIIIITYSLTIITGHVINRRQRNTDAVVSDSKHISNLSVASIDSGTPTQSRRRITKGRVLVGTERHSDRPYVPDILHTEEGDASTKPLLLEDSLRVNNYSAMSISTSSIIHNVEVRLAKLPTKEFKPHTTYEKTSLDNDYQGNENIEESSALISKSVDSSESGEVNDQIVNSGPPSTLAAFKQSCSLSEEQPSPLGDFHSRKVENLRNKQYQDDKTEDNKMRLNKRLTILCFSIFFSFGSLITFVVYISNAVNIGIFHGDPTALPGSEAYSLYQEGLRTAALGNLVLYITYMVISINNTRLIKLIGEKAQYVGCHIFLIAALLTLLLIKRVEVYFVFMVSCGTLRTCVFTLPYILANKFIQDEDSTGKNNSQNQSKNLGKVMSLIGFMLPAHYMIVSAFMGPLMDTTGDVWVPLIYSLCASIASLLIFIPLFFVKN